MISTTSSCVLLMPWQSFIVGCVGYILYVIVSYICSRIELQDPLDTAAIHFTSGFLSMLSVIISSPKTVEEVYRYIQSIEEINNPKKIPITPFVYKGAGYVFGFQLLGIVLICAWSMLWIYIILKLIPEKYREIPLSQRAVPNFFMLQQSPSWLKIFYYKNGKQKIPTINGPQDINRDIN